MSFLYFYFDTDYGKMYSVFIRLTRQFVAFPILLFMGEKVRPYHTLDICSTAKYRMQRLSIEYLFILCVEHF